MRLHLDDIVSSRQTILKGTVEKKPTCSSRTFKDTTPSLLNSIEKTPHERRLCAVRLKRKLEIDQFCIFHDVKYSSKEY